jgi:hypothetical protein
MAAVLAIGSPAIAGVGVTLGMNTGAGVAPGNDAVGDWDPTVAVVTVTAFPTAVLPSPQARRTTAPNALAKHMGMRRDTMES